MSLGSSLDFGPVPGFGSNFSFSLTSCFLTEPSVRILQAYGAACVLVLLPLCAAVLLHGVRRRRTSGRSPSPPAAAAVSHADAFAYHMALIELVGVCGCVLACSSLTGERQRVAWLINGLADFASVGQMSLHMLTCLERHLAVVHPVTYRALRGQRGRRLRRVSVGAAWLVSLVSSLFSGYYVFYVAFNFSFLIASLAVVLFCSVSVLRVLVRPGPGERGGTEPRVARSKRRAFSIIAAVLGVLASKFVLSLIWKVLNVSHQQVDCVMFTCEIWFHLPSSLLLPLLFLHRKGRLACC